MDKIKKRDVYVQWDIQLSARIKIFVHATTSIVKICINEMSQLYT